MTNILGEYEVVLVEEEKIGDVSHTTTKYFKKFEHFQQHQIDLISDDNFFNFEINEIEGCDCDECKGAEDVTLEVECKTTPEDLACFEQVAGVIGHFAAKQELQKVIDSGIGVVVEESLGYAFLWDSSPQEHEFWSSIHTQSRINNI